MTDFDAVTRFIGISSIFLGLVTVAIGVCLCFLAGKG